MNKKEPSPLLRPLLPWLAFVMLGGALELGCIRVWSAEPDPPTPPVLTPNALPFTLEFVRRTEPAFANLPALQSYASAELPGGRWLIAGGRTVGLHTFSPPPGTNFPTTSYTRSLYVVDPNQGAFWSFDVTQLPPEIAAPLRAANHHAYYDRSQDRLFMAGGYGWNSDQSDMLTFDTLITFPVKPMADAITSDPQDPAAIQRLITVRRSPFFQATGGGLKKIDDDFYLLFGQIAMGQYTAFGPGANRSNFKQTYTERILKFHLDQQFNLIGEPGTLAGGEAPNRPFHRRDGNIVNSVDPQTGQPRIAAFGGVFPPGRIAAYTAPIHINPPSNAAFEDARGHQKFSQYECPVIPIYDSAQKTTFHTFFGGIGHYIFFETATQRWARVVVTTNLPSVKPSGGRNDGLPFSADVTTFLQRHDGSYEEYIHPEPTPGCVLAGASVEFLVRPALFDAGQAYPNGVIKLDAFKANSRVLVGHIYGGIVAVNPLPLAPNSGTYSTNSVYEVYLNRKPSAAYAARYAFPASSTNAFLWKP